MQGVNLPYQRPLPNMWSAPQWHSSLTPSPADTPRSTSSLSYRSKNLKSPEPYQELFRPTTITTITAGNPTKESKKRGGTEASKPKTASKTMKIQPLTETEFEALPPSIQRKYFSTLERLRIADGAAAAPNGRLTTANARRPSTSSSHRPGLSRVPSRIEHRDASGPRTRLRRRQSEREEYALNQVEAQWFMTLPEKIKRQQFSKEEQTVLTKQCETVILDPADEALVRTSSKVSHVTAAREGAVSTPPVPSHSSTRPGLRSSVDSERRASDPITAMSTSPYPDMPIRQLRRPSINHSGNSKALVRTPSVRAGKPSMQLKRSLSLTASSPARRPSMTQEIHTVFYQDEDVRKKLRLYLGSPQKFDEVIEFGFPSTMQSAEDDIDLLDSSLQQTSFNSRVLDNDVQKFLAGNGDSLSFLDIPDESSTFLEDSDEDGLDDGLDSLIDNLIDDYKDPLVTDTSSVSDVEAPSTPSSEFEDDFEMVGPTPGHYLASKKPSLASLKSSATPAPAKITTPLARKPSIVEPLDIKSDTSKPLPPAPSDNLTPRARKPSRTDFYERALLSNREMTLRLTLTRPELRASEEDIYGWQNDLQRSKKLIQLGVDPLALDDLPPLAEDECGALGAFGAGKRGAVTKVWKMMGRK